MSYAAEPYAQFVNDLLTSLTGGVVREQFTFLPEDGPFRLSPPAPLIKSTLQVFGQSGGVYANFQRDRDFALTADFAIQWNAAADGTPAADAVWPDEGTPFYVNYDYAAPSGPAPLLTDRNPGSVIRILAESFAREYAVLSRQLESVYKAGFLDTATSRDLDQLVALLGLARRDRTFAVGTVIFARSTPAPADAFVQATTKLSTGEPPSVVFETTEDRTLHRGDLTVEVPIRATVSGEAGVVPARAITVIHRPIIGIESVSNAQTTQLAGADETDDALRVRARRALEGSGKATTGALLAALTTLPELREKDIRIAEDHLARPGVITVNVAAPLDAVGAPARAVALIEEARPAGVRVIHNLDAPPPLIGGALPPNLVDDSEAATPGDPVVDGLYLPVQIHAVLLPAAPTLSAADRAALKAKGRDAARAFVTDAGIGEALVYNRLVANLMAIDGVLDVAVELYPKPKTGDAGPRHQNVSPGSALRARLDDADLNVEVAGEIVAFDVETKVTLTALGKVGDDKANLEDARLQIIAQLQDTIGHLPGPLDPERLRKLIVPTDFYSVDSLNYTVQYLEAGLRIQTPNPALTLTELERPWIRTVKLAEGSG